MTERSLELSFEMSQGHIVHKRKHVAPKSADHLVLHKPYSNSARGLTRMTSQRHVTDLRCAASHLAGGGHESSRHNPHPASRGAALIGTSSGLNETQSLALGINNLQHSLLINNHVESLWRLRTRHHGGQCGRCWNYAAVSNLWKPRRKTIRSRALLIWNRRLLHAKSARKYWRCHGRVCKPLQSQLRKPSCASGASEQRRPWSRPNVAESKRRTATRAL